MLTHRGFSAWITVDDQPLPEYLAAVDEGSHRVSCWIPGEEGQMFTVWWQDHGGKVDTCAFIILDGLAVPGRFLAGEGVTSRSGIRASHMTEKPFLFTKVPQKTEGGENFNKDAGIILLKIKRVKRVEARPSNSVQRVGSVAASGKKVGDLCVGFGQERASELQYHSTWSVKPYDKESRSDKPSTYVSFVFRYRSADFLESQGIATGVKKTIAPKVGEKRRVASLPPNMAGPLVTPSPSPPKRPRLTEPGGLATTILSQGALATRRPSGDTRNRTPSWKDHSAQGVVIFPRSTSVSGAQLASSLSLQTLSSSSGSNTSETLTLSDEDVDSHWEGPST